MAEKTLPKYCAHCGRKLEPSYHDGGIWFDTDNGTPHITREYYLVCPAATARFTMHAIRRTKWEDFPATEIKLPWYKRVFGRRWHISGAVEGGGEASGV